MGPLAYPEFRLDIIAAHGATEGAGGYVAVWFHRQGISPITLSNYQAIKQSPNNKLRKRYRSISSECKCNVLNNLNLSIMTDPFDGYK
jgi:hypothetical protein